MPRVRPGICQPRQHQPMRQPSMPLVKDLEIKWRLLHRRREKQYHSSHHEVA